FECFNLQETQSDLEVILEFLEEYYRQNTGENGKEKGWKMKLSDKVYWAAGVPGVDDSSCEQLGMSYESPVSSLVAGRKVRLFHFLFEMLEDPTMAHCVSWVPAATGVFRFSSRNKDQLAALWGQRKGNKRPMTYQKMSRALRNYARSGEIFKVKKKLTYQFSPNTLMSLQKCHRGDL
ncbi:transcription factor Spi-C, partial [Thunnus maccoyii]|uniref:transcription factor Spi-C n=1 Tax=Thunnus maccoyii TaxID=8240 RepID=UPI001C4D2C50